jgi:hypothetical protein
MVKMEAARAGPALILPGYSLSTVWTNYLNMNICKLFLIVISSLPFLLKAIPAIARLTSAAATSTLAT